MHNTHLDNLTQMLELSTKVRNDADQAKDDAKQAKDDAKQAKDDAKKAYEQAEVAQTQASKAEEQRYNKLRQMELFQRKLDAQFRQLEEAQTKLDELDRRTQHVMRLRDRLFDMATKKLVNSTDASVAALGHQIQDQVFLEAKGLLTEYARQPGNDETGDSLENLVGTPEEVLHTALTGGLGFTFWQKYAKADGTLTGYVGVVNQTALAHEGIVYITVRDKRVHRVEVFPRGLSVATPDPDDWNDKWGKGYNLYVRHSGDRHSGDLGIDFFETDDQYWTMADTMNDFPGEKTPIAIHGSEMLLNFMSFADFKREGEIFQKAQAHRGDFGYLLAMLQNAEDFDANRIAEPFARDMANGLRDTFVRLLTEAVNRPTMSVKIAPGSALTDKVYGRIAAAALKPGFKITAVGSRQDSTMTSAQGETYFIRCEYHNLSSEADLEVRSEVTLTFARRGSDGAWMLLNFESSALVEEQREETAARGSQPRFTSRNGKNRTLVRREIGKEQRVKDCLRLRRVSLNGLLSGTYSSSRKHWTS